MPFLTCDLLKPVRKLATGFWKRCPLMIREEHLRRTSCFVSLPIQMLSCRNVIPGAVAAVLRSNQKIKSQRWLDRLSKTMEREAW